MIPRRLTAATLLLAAAPFLAGAAPGGPVEVDVKLVIATDVSLSMTDEEASLQRQGTAEVFLDSEVVKAIQSGRVGRIAVALLDWSSPVSYTHLTLPTKA